MARRLTIRAAAALKKITIHNANGNRRSNGFEKWVQEITHPNTLPSGTWPHLILKSFG